MPAPPLSVTIRVPATSANLGPGFDALGLALALYDDIRVSFLRPGGPPVRVSVQGPGAERVPRNAGNLVYRSFRHACRAAGQKTPGVDIDIKIRLPVAGGLGSSSAAIVGGLMAANEWLGHRFSKDRLVAMAAGMEGHPDNVAPAFLGGLCMAVLDGGRVFSVSWSKPSLFRNLKAVVCVPNFSLLTTRARRALPARVPRADAVFNTGRVALLLGAWREGRWDLLGRAMEDRLHQPHRSRLVPGLTDVIGAARRAGAWGAALSGAGPAVLALAPAARAGACAQAMIRAFGRAGPSARSLIVGVDTRGARVIRRTEDQ